LDSHFEEEWCQAPMKDSDPNVSSQVVVLFGVDNKLPVSDGGEVL